MQNLFGQNLTTEESSKHYYQQSKWNFEGYVEGHASYQGLNATSVFILQTYSVHHKEVLLIY